MHQHSSVSKKPSWKNTSTKPHKGESTYGLPQNKTAVSFIRTHELHPTPDAPDRQSLIYVTFGTFDGEFVLLEDEYHPGKFNTNHLSMIERLKFVTTYPIANCCLQNCYNSTKNRDEVVGYLVDIFSNVYSVNLTVYIQYNSRMSSLQPIVYSKIYQNVPKTIHKDSIHEEYPLLMHKYNNKITLFNIAGELKVLDLNQAHSKSWINNNSIVPDVEYSFGAKGLAACCSNYPSSLGSVVVVAVKNNQIPYVFIEGDSQRKIEHDRRCMDKHFLDWEQSILEITFCSFDSTTNTVAVSLLSSEIELYEIRKSTETGQTFHYCQKVLKYSPIGGIFVKLIEYIHTGKGYLAVTFCDEYLLMDLKTRTIKKRGRGNKDKNRVEKLKWAHIVDRENVSLAIVLGKGYNHLNPQQSRLGKPNLHFKSMDLHKDPK